MDIRKYKILFVDDEPDILNLGKQFLEKINPKFQVYTCDSAKDVLKKLQNEFFDVIIADYQMPVINGLQLLSEIRNNDNDIPFIIYTGRGAESVAMKALNLGANRYFQKSTKNLKTQFTLLANAIEQEISFHDTKIRTKRLERILKAIRNVNQLIVREANLEKLLQETCNRLIETEGCTTCCVFYLRGKKSLFRMASTKKIKQPPNNSFDKDPLRYNCFKSLQKQVRLNKNNDYTITQHKCQCLQDSKKQMIFAKELISKNNFFGIITFSLDTTIDLEKEEIELFLELTSDVSYALYNLELEEHRRVIQQGLISKVDVLSYAPVGIGSFDNNLSFLVVNKKFEEITGYNLQDLENKKFYDLFSSINDWRKIERQLTNPDTIPIKIDTQWISRSRSIVFISLLVSTTANRNSYTFTIFDRSEMVLAQEHVRFLKTLLKHESKNIAHTMRGYIELIDQNKLSHNERGYLTNIVKKIEETRDLLDKITLQLGRDKLDGNINIASIIKEALNNNRSTLTNKGIKVKMIIQDINVKGNILLVQVFDNLIQNSIKHSQCSSIRIVTHTSSTDSLEVIYEDDGIGIKAELQKYLFQRGFNGKREPGFGYGTYLIRKIVEDYGGNIEYIPNTESGGVKFKITLRR